MRRAISAAFMLFSASAAWAGDEFCGEKFTAPEALEAFIKAKPGIKVLQTDSTVISYSDANAAIIWNFATKDNPAFPSVVCRKVVQDGGAFYVKTDIRCGAAKSECDRLAIAYNELDRKMREAVEGAKR